VESDGWWYLTRDAEEKAGAIEGRHLNRKQGMADAERTILDLNEAHTLRWFADRVKEVIEDARKAKAKAENSK